MNYPESIATQVGTPQGLDNYWLPFTPNRYFREHSKLITGAEGAYFILSDGRKVFDADVDFSVSENPTFRFNFVPHGKGELRADVTDSKDAQFVGTLAIG